MRRAHFYPALSVFTLLLLISTSGNALVYVVKAHDKFSKILGKHIPGPVWGDNGSFRKAISLNQQIRDPNFIRPGDQVKLPDGVVQSNEGPPVSDRKPSQETVPQILSTSLPASALDQSETQIELTPFFSMTELTAKDLSTNAQSTLASNLSFGLEARFIQKWDANLKSFILAKLGHVSFQSPMVSNKRLSDDSKFLSTLGLGGMMSVSPRSTLSLYANLEKELFIRADSTTSVTVDSVLIPSIGAKATYDLVKLNAFTLNASGIFERKFGSTTDAFTVGQGVRYGGILGVRQHNIRGDMLELDLSALNRSQDTQVTSQKETTYTLSLRLYFSSPSSSNSQGVAP